MKRVLGIDPGLADLGWAVVEVAGDVTRLVVASGTHPAARQGHAVSVTIPAFTVTAADGSPNATPITLTGTITEGTDVLHLP